MKISGGGGIIIITNPNLFSDLCGNGDIPVQYGHYI